MITTNDVDLAVKITKKNADKAKISTPILKGLSTFAIRSLHRTRTAKENLEASRAQDAVKKTVPTMFAHLLPASSSTKQPIARKLR